MKIKVWKDPYDTGVSVTTAKTIDIVPGLTVLVGCNGSGKTTLLHNIKSTLEEKDIPVLFMNCLLYTSDAADD